MASDSMSDSARLNLGSSFGLMQGRLSPQEARGYQTFPFLTWRHEFELARKLGFSHIEWIVEEFDIHSNPILSNPTEIGDKSKREGVQVVSLCADFLMTSPLARRKKKIWTLFEKVLKSAASLGISVVVVPCVDESSLLREENLENLVHSLPRMLMLAEDFGVLIALETDLPPKELKELLLRFETPYLTVNYDCGNSASLGYDFKEEIQSYGERISDFHIKDRTLGGPTVELGTGAVDFQEVLSFLLGSRFNGVVTMQAMRDQDGPPSVMRQLEWLRNRVMSHQLNVSK